MYPTILCMSTHVHALYRGRSRYSYVCARRTLLRHYLRIRAHMSADPFGAFTGSVAATVRRTSQAGDTSESTNAMVKEP